MRMTPPNAQRFNGQLIEPGEAVEVSEADGQALAAEGWTVADDSEPEPEPEEIETDEEEI